MKPLNSGALDKLCPCYLGSSSNNALKQFSAPRPFDLFTLMGRCSGGEKAIGPFAIGHGTFIDEPRRRTLGCVLRAIRVLLT